MSGEFDLYDDDEEEKIIEVQNGVEEARLARRLRQKKMKEALERAQMLTEVLGEQPFKPGVDPGLKIWIYVREQLRAVNRGEIKLSETFPTRIKYKYRTYWMEETHKEWPAMIAEAIQAEVDKIRIDQEKLDQLQLVKDKEDALATYWQNIYDTETPEEKDARIASNIADRKVAEAESKLMRDEEHESYEVEQAYRLWLEEGAEIALEKLRKTPGILFHDDGTIREDRGVYGVLPLFDKTLPRRVPGLTLDQFTHYATYSNDRPGTLLLAFNHHHWKYFELIMNAAGAGARQLINLPIYEKSGRTLLHLAVLQGDQERVQYLLDHQANPLIADNRGDTPLHICFDHEVFIHFHSVAIGANLLKSRHIDKKKANKRSEQLVNKPNHRGVTPLHRAILLGALDYVELFLKSKAKVYVFDQKNMLPIQYAKEEWEQEVKDLFNANIRFCGTLMHREMWAYIMSREFIVTIFDIVAPVCSTCKRKQYDCATLKKKDRRYWVYAHQLGKKSVK